MARPSETAFCVMMERLLWGKLVRVLVSIRTAPLRVKQSRLEPFKPITSRLPNFTSTTLTRPTPIGYPSRKSSVKEKETDRDDQNTHAQAGTVLRRPLHGLRGDGIENLRSRADALSRRPRCGISRALCCTPFSAPVKEECARFTRQCGISGTTQAMRTQPSGTTPRDLIKA